jgi:hypothetical protein
MGALLIYLGHPNPVVLMDLSKVAFLLNPVRRPAHLRASHNRSF